MLSKGIGRWRQRAVGVLLTAAGLAGTVAVGAPAAVAAATPPSSAPSTNATARGFETCAAPDLTTMSTWAASSPYKAVGIHIGGPSQACAQPNLTPAWVTSVAAGGWALMPIYSGHQGSSGTALLPTDVGAAQQQGTTDADDAIAKASALGLGTGSVIYLDVQAYTPATQPQVIKYLVGWTRELQTGGYRSGVHGDATGVVTDLEAADTGSFPEPDVIWSRNLNGTQTTGDAATGLLGPTYWPVGGRVHEYADSQSETYGGATLTVNDSYLDVTSKAFSSPIATGSRLDGGMSVSSTSMTLTMGTDGNLVLYAIVGPTGQIAAVWDSNTVGNPGAYLVMQTDGNLVVYKPGGNSSTGNAIWSSSTWSTPGTYAAVQDDGNFVVYKAGGGDGLGGSLWSTRTEAVPNTINPGGTLADGQWTQGALTKLIMQADGNLVIYRKSDGVPIWSTQTNNNRGDYAIMQTDGNLVVYKAGGSSSTGGALWDSKTYYNPGAYLVMQDDGNLVIYKQGGTSANGGFLWASGTYNAA
ncbi:hypothetical protein P3T36_007619 [Kitasatospora sp. MAP12-15]|uniref:glycoside hydrolase domain-containing protein n=1 Tax=unclassified Kitasatospora TaxID=2633591 RepID=UPI002474CC36|nr:glycoside hydrolase domain-containing protein [Kitasatospora sp. MAP12-44]MDH6112728.1 hypothetical protein [Kitasatospora sp. MAP12-44]